LGTDCTLWQLFGEGVVKNPTGPGSAQVVRITSAQVPVTVTDSLSFDDSFIYSYGDVTTTGGGNFLQQAIFAVGNFTQTGGSSEVQASARVISVGGTISISNLAGLGPAPPPTLPTLTANMTSSQTVANVSTTAGWLTAGALKIDNEWMTYSGLGSTSAACGVSAPTPYRCFTGLSRHANSTTAAAHNSGAVVDWPLPQLTAPMDATQTTANVTTTFGWPSSVPAGADSAGMVKIDNEYMTYTGTTATSFTGLVRGYVSTHPATTHNTNTAVDGRLAEVHAAGGCSGGCNGIRSVAPIDNVPLTPPVLNFDPAAARTDAAPGPNHLPSPGCAINFAGSLTNPYFNSATGTVDLTPASSYTCTATGGGFGDGSGQLSWNNATKVLTVRGVIFLPANATYSQNASYDSPSPGATIYVAGGFTFGGGKNLCGLRRATTLSANMTSSQTSASVASTTGSPTSALNVSTTSGFPSSGTLQIEGEQVTYSGLTASSFTGLSRHANGTTAAAHSSGALVTEVDCDHADWNPNTNNDLAIVSPTLPSPYDTMSHNYSGSSGPSFQGVVYTKGSLTTSGGGALSGTIFANGVSTSGNAAAPAPGILHLPLGLNAPKSYTIGALGTFSG